MMKMCCNCLYFSKRQPHVAIAVVDLLQELTDIDTLHESEEGAEVLIDALVSSKLTSVFVVDHSTLSGSILKFLCFWIQTRQRKMDYWSSLVNTK